MSTISQGVPNLPAICWPEAFITCLVTSSISVCVVIHTLHVLIGQSPGNLGEGASRAGIIAVIDDTVEFAASFSFIFR